MKKTLFFIFFSVIFLCGCARETQTTVQFASWGSASETAVLKPLLLKFEQENPDIKVDFLHIPQNYFQKLHLLFASNTAPDVIFINNLNLPLYAEAGLLEEISVPDSADFFEKSNKALSWKGKQYAVPRDFSSMVIFYNKSAFDSKGLPYPNPSWTTEDFLKTAQSLTDKNTFGISFEEDLLFYLPYLMSFGGGVLSDDLSSEIINSPESQAGLQFYADLRNKYHVAPKKFESASMTMAQMFLQGKLAMHLSGRWLVPKYRKEALFDWDIINFPNGKAGSVVPLDASGWAVSKSSKHKAEARKLIDFLASSESAQAFTASGLITPARIDVATSDSFLDGKKPLHSRFFLDTVGSAKVTPVSLNYAELSDRLKQKNELIFNQRASSL